MTRYLKIIWLFAKMSLLKQMAFRPSFFLAVLGKTARMLILILFFNVIYRYTYQISGWGEQGFFLIILIYLTVESLIVVTFHRNLSYYFPKMILTGDFDLLLTKPVNTLFYSAFSVIDLMDLASFVLVIILWVYYFIHYQISVNISHLLLFLANLGNALVFIFALLLLIASSAFWTTYTDGLGRFFENIIRTTRFPADIFTRTTRVLFFYIVPIAFITTLPAQNFVHIINWSYTVFSFVFTIILLIISLKFWNYALKKYSSASS